MKIYEPSNLDIFIRIILALIAGGAIGFIREIKGKSAGFVTHMLVSVGAATIAIIQCIIASYLYDIGKPIDPTRIIAQVVSGVGFLGAGTIIREKGSIKGITSAAAIWTVSSIGLAFGMGFLKLGFFITLCVLTAIFLLKKIEIYFPLKKDTVTLYVTVAYGINPELFVTPILFKHFITIKKIQSYSKRQFNKEKEVIIVSASVPKFVDLEPAIKDLIDDRNIFDVKIY